MTQNILVVDDDEKVRRLLRHCFEPEGFGVFEAASGQELDDCLTREQIHLITLDLNLGAENGLTIASRLRASCDIPIVIVTGKGDVIDKVVGLEMGADDYISKPFHVREVIARVRSVMRRSAGATAKNDEETPVISQQNGGSQVLEFEGWKADPSRFELTDPTGNHCELTTADFKLLMVLLENAKRVLSRDQIMDHLNGGEWTPLDRTIDNQIARLRKKIEIEPNKPQFIKTVRGVGYLMAADVHLTQ